MAKVWIQTATLMILLVMSCPGSQATAIQYLCGSELVDALYFVCGDRGFFYRPHTADSPMQGNAASAVGGNVGTDFGEKMGVLERCCHKGCDISELQSYCLRAVGRS